MRARTGLWEPRVGNNPGPPGPTRATAASQAATVLSTGARRPCCVRAQDMPWYAAVVRLRSRSPNARIESRLYHFDCARRVNSGDHMNQIGSAPGVRHRRALTGSVFGHKHPSRRGKCCLASAKEVIKFFESIRSLYSEGAPALLDTGLRVWDEAVVAEHDGQVVGAVTLAFNDLDRPEPGTLDALRP